MQEKEPKQEKPLNSYPAEVIELPSKGKTYPDDNLLSKGDVEMKLMTAKEEDILSSQNLIKSGTVIDKLLKSMLVTEFNYDSLLIGDKDMLMFAARILGFGKDYEFKTTCPHCDTQTNLTIDLTDIPYKEINYDLLNKNNEYEFELPSKNLITFRLITVGINKDIEAELKGLERMVGVGKSDNQKEKDVVKKEYTTRLKHMITSVNGDKSPKTIRTFVDTMLTRDTTEFKKHLSTITPGLDYTINYECSNPECTFINDIKIPMTIDFFWPTFGA